MDIADLAQTQNEPIHDLRISAIVQAAHQAAPLNYSGMCWTCGEPVPDQRRWCDAECRDLDLAEPL